ncbi:MAG TPA: ribosome silencing factor [Candidatus Eisenbacteria bacterium]|nr:ribosome silencing factor [Candidatus Eisenbacteria bacterium]
MAAISSWDKALLLVGSALEKKACDLVLMEVRELSSIADYFIICSGRSDRQVQSIAQGIEESLHRAGEVPLSIEGMTRGHWVLMDFIDVVVHIFYQPVREFYDLDGLWGHAPRVALPEPYSTLAEQLHTGTGPSE